jgi:hypothetical protein
MKPLKFICFSVLTLGVFFKSFAQTQDLFRGIKLKESPAVVRSKLAPYAERIKRIEIDHPSFPLAKDREEHLVGLNCRTGNGKIKEIVFTFADDQLVFVQAYGNAIAALTGKRKDTADTYLEYMCYWKDLVFTRPEEDKVWVLAPEAAHPNLFTWENPYLQSNDGLSKNYNSSARIPEFVQMGGKIKTLRHLLEKASGFTTTLELDGSDPYAQLQIDCFGIEYAGFPRKFEMRFGDDKLNAVWILTGQGEEERLRQKLTSEYGPAIYQNEVWEVYANWQVMLRKDKPEVLLVTEELGNFYRKDYFKQD